MAHTAARLLAAALIVLPLAALPGGAAHAETSVGVAQGESFAFTSTLGAAVADPTAQGGQALRFLRTGTASRAVPVSSAATALTLRVRGDQCDGAPQLRVAVDGRALSTSSVSSTTWTTVRVPVTAAAGQRQVAVAFLNDYRSERCDRNLHLDVASFTAATTAPPAPAGSLVFDADVASKGLAAYASVHNANRITVVDDPVLGSARKVLRFRVYDTDDQLTGNPRAQAETATFWTSGAEHYVGASFYFPRDFPLQQDTKQWVNLGEVYGAPYAGASPNALFVKRVSSGGQVIAWQRNGNYAWDRPFEVPLVKGRWHDFVFRIKLSSDPAVGFWEAWSNTGSGWQRLKLNGQDRLYARTIDSSNGAGPNYHKLAHYRSKGMWPVATHYAADHKIGSSFAAVAPHSHS